MNWKRLVNDLIVSGFTQEQLAKECDCGQSSISELKTGTTKEPRANVGLRLAELHRLHVASGKRAAA